MIEYKKSFMDSEKAYLDGLRFLATDDKKLQKDLFKLTLLFNMLDWSALCNTTEEEKAHLICLIKRIITLGKFCLPEFKDQYGNVNIPQNIYDFAKLSVDYDEEGAFSLAAAVIQAEDLKLVSKDKKRE